jgi:hypothetical protein
VAVAVPSQRRDAIAESDSASGERIGHATRALAQVAVGLPVKIALNATGHDLLISMIALCVSEKRRDQQRLLHHHSVHGRTLLRVESHISSVRRRDFCAALKVRC